MSYSIRHSEADRWTVINDDDMAVFTGSLRECEDWLDSWENAARPRRSLMRTLFDRMRGLFGIRPGAENPAAPVIPSENGSETRTEGNEIGTP
jgi:hypothetical protein